MLKIENENSCVCVFSKCLLDVTVGMLQHWLIILLWRTHSLQALRYLWNMAKVGIKLMMHFLVGRLFS